MNRKYPSLENKKFELCVNGINFRRLTFVSGPIVSVIKPDQETGIVYISVITYAICRRYTFKLETDWTLIKAISKTDRFE